MIYHGYLCLNYRLFFLFAKTHIYLSNFLFSKDIFKALVTFKFPKLVFLLQTFIIENKNVNQIKLV